MLGLFGEIIETLLVTGGPPKDRATGHRRWLWWTMLVVTIALVCWAIATKLDVS